MLVAAAVHLLEAPDRESSLELIDQAFIQPSGFLVASKTLPRVNQNVAFDPVVVGILCRDLR